MKRTTWKLAVIFPIVGLALSLLSSGAAAQEYKKITRFGTSESMCRGGVNTIAEFQAYVAENEAEIRQMLTESGWAGSNDDLIAAVAAGEITETSYPYGTRLAWSGSKKKGKFVALPYREWASRTPFEAFRVDVSSDCRIYEIVAPKACCNISLKSVRDDNESDACRPPEPAPEPIPVVSAPKPEKKALGFFPFFGAFIGSETVPKFETAWNANVVETSSIGGIRAGFLTELSAKWAAFGQLSYYRRDVSDGFEYPDDGLAVDVGLDRKLGKNAFIGGGIGLWNVNESDSDGRDFSYFVHVGGDMGASNFQWFIEGRLFDGEVSELDSASDNRMLLGGVRYIVK